MTGAQQHDCAQREDKRYPFQLLFHIASLLKSRPVAGRVLTNCYFQLQFGCVLEPVNVNGFCCVPSASMVQISSFPDRFD